MRKTFLSFICLLFALSVFSQTRVRFEIESLPQQTTNVTKDDIYIAGSFNGWNPKDPAYRFSPTKNNTQFITFTLAPGRYEYKITRGSWDKVECNADGSPIGNRILEIGSGDKSESVSVKAWNDQFEKKAKQSTASKNVSILKIDFPVPQLNTTRRVWIYLPSDYASKQRRYPVLYMHDGQNVFEDTTAFSGEWGVDEMMDTVWSSCIVVAIDHGGAKRINEYAPYDMEKYGKGEGGAYVDFLVKTLKPYIDRHYRTLKKKETTYVAGSSMGGLISMYAILKYPKTFGAAGVFSPAFWIAPKINEEIARKGEKYKGKVYFYAGKEEGETMVPLTLKAFEEMSGVSKAKMTVVIRDEGKHNEPTWRKEFPLFYQWILGK